MNNKNEANKKIKALRHARQKLLNVQAKYYAKQIKLLENELKEKDRIHIEILKIIH